MLGATMAAFLDEAGKAALLQAVRDVESHSAAEIVVAVRAQSGSYLHADLLAALLGAGATLVVLLFSPWPFATVSILIDSVVGGLLAGLFSFRTPSVRRRLSSSKQMRQAVECMAKATFFDQGIGETRGRTGLLVYVSQLERGVHVVCDKGVREAVVPGEWEATLTRTVGTMRAGGRAEALARELSALGPVLGAVLPRADDDVNELSDGVRA